ncbi:hypothetical protein Galf_0741 [Gallionella capsiferriformans ES-2]|uniref:Uncharacterized protein n=1 Tax=Gallionella capsiferriformans (strain ES-2) TaxID=395494 RepID=D9SDM1_GALCS|nr:hypothetical protein Galf_0741 [Gallionella capsiferriformans ES-2]
MYLLKKRLFRLATYLSMHRMDTLISKNSYADASGESSFLCRKFTYMLIFAHELADNLLF